MFVQTAAELRDRRAGRHAAAASKPPRVVLRFALYTALALLISGTSMFWFLRHFATDRAERAVAFHTKFVADTILRSDLEPSDFSRPLAGKRLAALDALFRREVMTGDDLRVKLYGRDGTVTYSNDQTLIGARTPNDEVEEAFSGRTVREVSNLNHEGGRGRDVRVLESYTPVRLGDAARPAGVFELYHAYAPVAREGWQAAQGPAIVLALALLALYVALFPILRRLTASLEARNLRLSEQARALEHTLAERERAEAALRQSEEQLRQAQKMEAVGQLAGGVAHDFNNLMSAVVGFAELVLHRLGEGHPLRGQVEEIMRAGERASEMTNQLLAFSRKQVLQPRVLDMNTVVADSKTLLRRLIGEDIELALFLDPELEPVEADPVQLEQVIVNLAVNARDAMPTGGKLTIETSNAELDETYTAAHLDVEPGAYVQLAITDTGVGMDTETRSHIFEPFFTTKDEGKGTGLGLATVFGIVKQSGGDVSVHSEPGRGTTFRIYLPRAEHQAEQRERPAGRPALPRGSETVLVVEDEELVRNLECEVLEECGYTVLAAQSPVEALAVAAARKEPIDLLLTDVVMPGLSGRELAEGLTPVRPEMKVLYSSGYADDAVIRHGVREAEVAFLPKPLTPTTLAAKVREVLDTPAGKPAHEGRLS